MRCTKCFGLVACSLCNSTGWLHKKKNQVFTAGIGSDVLSYDTGIHRCGKINGGIGFMHDNDGWWVMGFDDLERIYLKAKKVRTDVIRKAIGDYEDRRNR
jgi:hypothetical protein